MQGSDEVRLTTLKTIPDGVAARSEKVGWRPGRKASPSSRPKRMVVLTKMVAVEGRGGEEQRQQSLVLREGGGLRAGDSQARDGCRGTHRDKEREQD